MGRPTTDPSYRELLTAPPIVSAVFAGRFHSIGRDRVGPTIRAGLFPVEVIETAGKKVCTKTALIKSLGVTPADVVVLAEMEAAADKYAPSKSLAHSENPLNSNDFDDGFGEGI
jgi:hypothetical protein